MNNTQIDLLTDSSYDSALYFFYVKHTVANLTKHLTTTFIHINLSRTTVNFTNELYEFYFTKRIF